MANVNRVILIGNLTRDPQLKYLPSQTAVVEFGLATNRRYKTASGEERDEVCFVDCSAFGRMAEVINQYCQKGKQLYIEGRLKFDSWEDKQGGGKRSKLSVVVENFQFLGGREGAGAGGGGAPAQEAGTEDQTRPPAARPPQRSSPPPAAPPPAQEPPLGNEQHFNDSDIPF
ncbi:MAG: single-stranded DNA-binding protein [Tepidisphaeraceae bacterium]|jgi:single-strand DNA-binding protein